MAIRCPESKQTQFPVKLSFECPKFIVRSFSITWDVQLEFLPPLALYLPCNPCVVTKVSRCKDAGAPTLSSRSQFVLRPDWFAAYRWPGRYPWRAWIGLSIIWELDGEIMLKSKTTKTRMLQRYLRWVEQLEDRRMLSIDTSFTARSIRLILSTLRPSFPFLPI